MADASLLERNKIVVQRFNREVLEAGDEQAFRELLAPDFVNHSAPPGTPNGAEGMWRTVKEVLHPAFPDLKVEIHDQVAEGDRVFSRKTIHATHLGPLFGVAATGRRVSVSVFDVVRVLDGRYVEHWGMNTLANVVEALRSGA
jgi:predicted ester cyclase